MTSFKTYEFALLPCESQKMAIRQLLDKRDYTYNQLSDMANNLYDYGAGKEEIRARINRHYIDSCICYKEAEELRKQIFSLLGKMSRGEIEHISHKALHPRRRRIRLQNAWLNGQFVLLPALGAIKIVLHRPIPTNANIFSVALIEECYGTKFRIALGIVYDECSSRVSGNKTYNVIGLDYKQQGLYVDSNGLCADYPGYFRAGKGKIDDLNRAAAQHKTGSSRWLKLKRRADKLERHLINQRKDWQNKRANELARENDAVCIETLDFKAMQNVNPMLGPQIMDNDYTGFTQILGKKLEEQGKQLVKVSQYYPSSQICSVCGYRFGKLPLSQRIVACPCCGTIIDRDFNAARNIRNEGIRLLNAA